MIDEQSGATGSITKQGNRELLLRPYTGSSTLQNTYTGGFTLVSGKLILGDNDSTSPSYVPYQPLGTGPFTIHGGTVALDSSQPARLISNAVNITGNPTFEGIGSMEFSGSVDLQFATRTLTIGTTTLPSGTFTFSGSITNGGITKSGPATLVLSGSNSYSGGTTISAGTLQIGSGGTSGSITGSVTDDAMLAFNRSDSFSFGGTVTGSGAITKLGTGTATIAPFTVGGTVTVSGGTLAASAGSGTSKAGDLDASAAQYDLADNRLVLSASSVAAVLPQLASGYHLGAWDGLGIVSSTAAADSNQVTAVGYGTGADLYGLTGTTTSLWNGQTIDANSVLLQYTYYGDTDLDGNVDFDDIALTDRGHRRGLTGWLNGDFNYDGVVDDDDYDLLNAAYAYLHPAGALARGEGGGSSGDYEPILPPVDGFTEEFVAGRVERFGQGYADALAVLLAEDEGGGEMSMMMTVPEPGCGALVVVVGTAVGVRRRRLR